MSVRYVERTLERLWAEDEAWRRKLEADSDDIERNLPLGLRGLHEAVVDRTRSVGASALILSGSTARGQRTHISDLDYHVIGPGIDVRDLSRELDLHVASEQKFVRDVLAGDDFVQWSLRYGHIVFDDGAVRRAIGLIVERQPWPDVERKLRHAAKSIELGDRFVASGDGDAALVQVRTALSLATRARLLAEGVFPLSRAELPEQLETIGLIPAAHALDASIYGSPSLIELAEAVRLGKEMLAGAPHRPDLVGQTTIGND